MTDIRFLHTADWQLGMTRHYLSDDAQPRFTAARLDAVRSIGELAVAEGCAFVVVCGDVFETNHVERKVVVRALEAMRAQPSVTFALLPGNHDPLDPASVYRSPTFTTNQPENVLVLDSTQPVEVAPGVQLVAATWTTKVPVTDLCAAALNASVGVAAASAEGTDGTVRILVGHGIVDELSPDRLNPSLIAQAGLEAALSDARVHYVALGDRHSTTSVGTSGRIWYSGAPEPTAYDELDPGNVLVVHLDAAGGVNVQPHRVGTWHFVLHEADVNGPDDLAALEQWLTALADKERTIVKLSLKGTLSLVDAAALDALLAHHADLLGALETWDRHTELVVLPNDTDYASLHVTGFAAEAVDDLRQLAEQDNDAARTARDALALVYRLSASES